MAEEVAIDLNIKTGEAEKNTQSLKGKLKQLKLELESLEEGSDAFNKIALEAAEAEDKLGDLSAKIKTLSSDTRKLDTVVGVAQGIAGGFAAATGAAALFGVESEDLNKTLLKVQSSVALLNGVQEISKALNKDSAVMTGINSAAQAVYAFVVNVSTGAVNKFRLALIATGLGAVIVLIGTLIAYWDDLTAAISKSNKELDTYNKLTETTSGAIKSQEEATANKIRNLKLQGASEKEILDAKIYGNKLVISLAQEELDASNKVNEESFKTLAELQKHREEKTALINLIEDRQLQNLEFEKAYHDEQQKIKQDAINKEAEAQDKLDEEDDAAAIVRKEKKEKESKENPELKAAEYERLTALQKQFNEAMAEDEADAEAKKKELEQAGRDEEKRISEEAAAAQIELDKKIEENELRHIAEVAAAKKKAIADGFAIATASANALSSLNALITQTENQNRSKNAKERLALEKKQFERGKALAIVTTVINTSQAIMAQMGAGPVGIALAALAGITGAIQIATIASQKFDGGGGSVSQVGNMGSVGAPEVGNQAPQVPQTPQSIPIPQQVYVTETDITGTQQQVNVIEGLSKIQ
jgi:hypothetical protein